MEKKLKVKPDCLIILPILAFLVFFFIVPEIVSNQ